MLLKLDHPANQQVLEYLKKGKLTDKISESPQNSVYARILVCRSKFIGYHPDIMNAHIANECKGLHPDTMLYATDCTLKWSLNDIRSWVIYGRPVLFHPGTGVIYGVPKRYEVVWRLPKDSEFIAKPEPEVGDDWYIVTKHNVNQDNFGKEKMQAYDYAGSLQEDGIEARRGGLAPAPASSAPRTMPPTQPSTMPPKNTKTMLNPDHPANQKALAYLKTNSIDDTISKSPKEWTYKGWHPDWLDASWSPNDTGAWVVYGRPVLVHPVTGVIFGLYLHDRPQRVLRLPKDSKSTEATPERKVGDDWYCLPRKYEVQQQAKLQAYDYAGSLQGDSIKAQHDESSAPHTTTPPAQSTTTAATLSKPISSLRPTRPPTETPTPKQQEDEQDETTCTIRVLEVLAILVAAFVKSADNSTTALKKFHDKLSHRLNE